MVTIPHVPHIEAFVYIFNFKYNKSREKYININIELNKLQKTSPSESPWYREIPFLCLLLDFQDSIQVFFHLCCMCYLSSSGFPQSWSFAGKEIHALSRRDQSLLVFPQSLSLGSWTLKELNKGGVVLTDSKDTLYIPKIMKWNHCKCWNRWGQIVWWSTLPYFLSV